MATATRLRTISQSEALYVGPTPATGTHYLNNKFSGVGMIAFTGALIGWAGNSGNNAVNALYRIQSYDYDIQIPRLLVNQFGELAPIDQVIVTSPTVNLGFSYLLANMVNEEFLGFNVDGSVSAISGILAKRQDEKNYFIKTVQEGIDAKNETTSGSVIGVAGVGNGFVTSYAANFAVGELPRVDVRVEGLNILFYNTVSGQLPSINPASGTRVTQYNYEIPTFTGSSGPGDLAISALRPGDVVMTIRKRLSVDEGVLANATGAYDLFGPYSLDSVDGNIQSANISFNLSRQPILKLGNPFAASREIQFPVPVTCTIDAIVNDITTGSLSDFLDCDNSFDVNIAVKRPNVCGGGTKPIVAQYWVKAAKVNSQAYRNSINNQKTVTMTFQSQVGGPNQSAIGVFMSGANA